MNRLLAAQKALNAQQARQLAFKNSPGYDPNIKLGWRSRLRLRRLYARHRVERWRERLADLIAP